MNWIFPIAGHGTRTKELRDYKPFIEILPGRNILKMCLVGLKDKISPEDNLFFIVSENQELEYSVKKNVTTVLCDLGLKNKANVLLLDKTPPGQAHTVKNGIEDLNKNILRSETFIVNSDQFVFFDLEDVDLKKPSVGLYFSDGSSSCFFDLDIKEHSVREIKEKQKISSYASSGVFYFPSGLELLKCIQWGIETNKQHNDELYLGPCMGYFDNLSYFQTLVKFDLGNIRKIGLFKEIIKNMEL